MEKLCEQCGNNFMLSKEDIDFYKKVGPTLNTKKFEIPPPNICYYCRQQKRLAFRNEKTLYKRSCDLCKKNIIATYHKDSPFPVYCQECYWSDKWNALDFGQEYEPNTPFFQQFKELMNKVPRLCVVNKQSENSEYCNYSFANKNCYLLFGSHYEEDCMYGRYSTKNKDCLDFFWLYESELSYQCTFSGKLYNCIYLDHSENCENCLFGMDLKSCKNCLFSFGLRNKKYCIFNEQKTKEEYEEYLKKLNLSSYAKFKKIYQGWLNFRYEKVIFRAKYQTNCENCEGTEHQNSKNLKKCFACSGCEDCSYGFQMDETWSSIDNSHMGYDKCELCFNTIGHNGTFHCLCCDSCWHSNDLIYCSLCFNSKDCFGSIGMRQNQYCILNKKYTKEEYEKLASRIIESMGDKWGEFFPKNVYPFAFNESVANEFTPLEKSEIEEFGWKYKEEEEKKGKTGENDIPDNIEDTTNEICDKILFCDITGKPFKILSKELNFYKKLKIPIPRNCPDQRIKDRIDMSSFMKSFERSCQKCNKKITTIYSEKTAKNIYCEDCYLKEVY
jgi:hypothetical protein